MGDCQASLHAWGHANQVTFDTSKEYSHLISIFCHISNSFKLLGFVFGGNCSCVKAPKNRGRSKFVITINSATDTVFIHSGTCEIIQILNAIIYKKHCGAILSRLAFTTWRHLSCTITFIVRNRSFWRRSIVQEPASAINTATYCNFHNIASSKCRTNFTATEDTVSAD